MKPGSKTMTFILGAAIAGAVAMAAPTAAQAVVLQQNVT
jgi:hypothetical protein